MSGESLLVHGHALLRAVDAASAPGDPAAMRPVNAVLDFELDAPPAGLRPLRRDARLILHFGQPPERIAALPPLSAAQLAVPAAPTLSLHGRVSDPQRRWQPRRFALDLAPGSVTLLPLYRAPLGVRRSAGGTLFGTLRLEDGTPAAWARLEVDVEVAPASTLRFVAQADAAGDFLLTLDRLALPPAEIANFAATLRVLHRAGQWPDGLDPDTQQAFNVQAADAADFAASYGFALQPGATTRLMSFQRDALVIRAP